MTRTIYQVLLDIEAQQKTILLAIAQSNSQDNLRGEMLAARIDQAAAVVTAAVKGLSDKLGELSDAPDEPTEISIEPN